MPIAYSCSPDVSILDLSRLIAFAEPGQKVKGMIIARSISEDLRLATSRVSDVELYEYELAISLNKIET